MLDRDLMLTLSVALRTTQRNWLPFPRTKMRETYACCSLHTLSIQHFSNDNDHRNIRTSHMSTPRSSVYIGLRE